MSKISAFYIILSFFLFSCVDKYDKNLKNLIGEWKLTEMSYQNEAGRKTSLTDVDLSIIFTDEDESLGMDGVNYDKKAKLIIEKDTIHFNYQFDFSMNEINIDIDTRLTEDKAIYTLGKHTGTYDYDLIGEESLIISSESEYDHFREIELFSPQYVFVKH